MDRRDAHLLACALDRHIPDDKDDGKTEVRSFTNGATTPASAECSQRGG
jgi:hypothetical protein